MTLKIIIADDHKIVREGLKTLLEKQSGIKVVAETSDGLAVVKLAQEHLPDLVIMDITMPGLNGIGATRRVKEICPAAKIMILSMHADRRYVMEALKAGAMGYLLKDSAFEELIQAIKSIVKGKIYLSSDITDVLVRDYLINERDADPSVYSLLSAREREVLQLLAEGKSTRQTADKLSISVKTVETHRQQLMQKLNLRGIAELTKYAVREGLTTL
ncbi:MAG: DNA-binding response regulator [Candidatus Edwardsbacteria bacterium RIFOXYD12_FULL_50_11]|jgi:DNA-binding NarL/FixJ family response regulator|uniref:DNA-binding response regulator n=1 Tax=Candidatus Edwardsbacteria bacterium GWF2_54_11 TaxID=1817851 RepID=A0A1F5RJY7_9BACT|nr:MAG: DNA-binding response regulator [Candidatus Edwardsbacteria bacterium RifOxyC12_full_54_24]OGF08731.1 MAG: DNA-binding response regulator [Candidatus Edwardsbacteria bacterium RifOxyA12_full_54_48]OGF12324.1 MAG: DNA-binding response regulator [Candidatus Edwardsbacteria bacterium GWE2_54_12]OGF14331.1 MAG: DNA-binding response regulator [Candidatus Edwardsbacteria bacterium GWF2_54_11]OGF15770.1 MAG: DNA-binding response regulator [Candidatus Edwardsbacteria bacterium RIFOXYD12_FULL_50_